MTKNMKKEKHEWERQPDEPDKCWLLFKSYLQMGNKRTISKAAELFGLHRNTVGNYVKKFNWNERAAAYDDYIYEQANNFYRRTIEKHEFQKFKQKLELSGRLQGLIEALMEYINSSILSPYDEEKFMRFKRLDYVISVLYKLIDKTDFSFSPLLMNIEKMKELGVFQHLNYFDLEEFEELCQQDKHENHSGEEETHNFDSMENDEGNRYASLNLDFGQIDNEKV